MSPIDQSQRHARSLRNLWINSQYQTRYIVWITLSGLFLVALNASIFYWFTRENYTLLVDLSPMTDDAKRQLYKELWQIIGLLIGASFLFLMIVGVIGLFFSHRAAGPLYHFQKVFQEIKNGKTSSRIHLRPNDDFKDVATSFNEMMDHIEKKQV